MPFTPKTILLAGAVGAIAMLGAFEAQAGHMHMPFGPIGALNPYPLDPTDPTMAYPLADEAIDAAEDTREAVADATEDAAAAAAAAALAAHAMAQEALDD
jgi:hypothetical protein